MIGMTHLLDQTTREQIYKFVLDDEILKLVSGYFGFIPRFNSVSLMLNVPRGGALEEGSKAWHRDENHFTALNLFVCINNVTNENGPYNAISTTIVPPYTAIPKTKFIYIGLSGLAIDTSMMKFRLL